MSAIEVKVPDIGDFKDIPVIDIMVKPGDSVKAEDSLVTLESDKATMDVPAPFAGKVKELKVKVGDKVSEGSLILHARLRRAAPSAAAAEHHKAAVSAPPAPTTAPAGVAEVRVPDIGDFKDVPVIEVLVKAGDTVKAEDALVTLESDKATMDVPGAARRRRARHRGEGRRQGERRRAGADAGDGRGARGAPRPRRSAAVRRLPRGQAAPRRPPSSHRRGRGAASTKRFALAYAGPGVRKLARELGVDWDR